MGGAAAAAAAVKRIPRIKFPQRHANSSSSAQKFPHHQPILLREAKLLFSQSARLSQKGKLRLFCWVASSDSVTNKLMKEGHRCLIFWYKIPSFLYYY
ncbi:hypothetical protein OIU74_023637 [Salix koriyanagi]|uniref:Uncharacterized protein n=1 Tax=Salix koriyanagi TaxID=2511006 RepID=A0A9Q1ABA3_9ROSI|nr:hypothetical protein OIU74_023637 [Salix koriyanagi]